jgi:poly(3-hydroxybutyrate) depolymerase
VNATWVQLELVTSAGKLAGSAVAIAGVVLGARAFVGLHPARSPVPVADLSQRYVADWEVTGPFPWAPAGTSETDLRPALDRPLFPQEPSITTGRSELPSVVLGRRTATVHGSNGEIRLDALFPGVEHQAALASTRIFSASAIEAALLVEADDGVRVWLNGSQVHQSTAAGRLQQFESYVRVHLQAGVNRLVVKLVRWTRRGGNWDSWSFAVGVRSLASARAERAERGFLQEVTTPLVTSEGRLGIDLTLYEADRTALIEVQDHLGEVVKRLRLPGGGRYSVDVSDLPDGVYHSRVPGSAAAEPFPFYKGDPATGQAQLVAQAAPLLADPVHQANVTALEKRLEHLMAPQHRENQDHLWQAKVAALLAEWSTIQTALASRRAPYRDVPGTHLRGIRSKIDGANQYYLLHVPRSYQRQRGPIPLVIIMPYTFQTLRPFLESIPVAEIAVLGMLARIADHEGLAFLWMDNRANTYGSDFGEADMFETLRQVSRDYAIDRERLYLFGSCAGGREALALAAKYPDRFAAVGTMSPAATFHTYDPERATDPHGLVAYDQKSPLKRLENLLHVPVYALHGDQNTHNPLEESLALRDAAARAGIDFRLDVVPGATHLRFPEEPRAVIFRWLAGHVRVRNPDRIVLTTSSLKYSRAFWMALDRMDVTGSDARLEAHYHDGEVTVITRNVGAYDLLVPLLLEKTGHLTVRTNGQVSFQGPITARQTVHISLTRDRPAPRKTSSLPGAVSDVFTGPFLIVVGTAGPEQQTVVNRRMAEELARSWQERYLGVCPIKIDGSVTAEDIRSSHLVLFGDPAPRGPLAALGEMLPFRRRGDVLEGPGGRRLGGELSVQYVYPNPLNPARYVLMAVTQARTGLPADAVQLTLKGWYDYAIWRWSPLGEPLLDDVGMFDAGWSTLVSQLHRS